MKVLEVAKIYSVSPLTVYNWISKGLKYKTVREIGKKPYKTISAEDLETFFKSRGKSNN